MAASNPYCLDQTKAKTGPIHHGRKVRVVAKIRRFTETEAQANVGASVPWISVNKPQGNASESVTISFGDQSASRKNSYQVDFCYEQNQGNQDIFLKEVKPLISGVFNGCNATIIALGARGTGKTNVIQGTEEELGLAALTMTDLLLMAEENEKSVLISYYEIFQDHVLDLLDANRREVVVLGDAQGKVQHKGLSQVPVTSVSEFQKLYGIGHSSCRTIQKTITEPPYRSHRGLIIYVSSQDEELNTVVVGKMNFVDLAGYEDIKRNTSDGVSFIKKTKINKTIYALHNVVWSLNANDGHVPYRESKLTRLLQDSLGGTSKILIVTCLNPSFCQDSISILSLASRSCQCMCQAISKSTKKNTSSTTPTILTSQRNQKVRSVISSTKKQSLPQTHFSQKKANCTASALKARKLFDEASNLKFEKANSLDTVSVAESSQQEEEKLASNVNKEIAPSEGVEDANADSVLEVSPLIVSNNWDTMIPKKDVFECSDYNYEEVMPSTKLFSVGEEEKENNRPLANEGGSPPISVRLEEVSNNLKLLYSSTPLNITMKSKDDVTFHGQTSTGFLEPRTPDQSIQANEVQEVENSPWETFSVQSSRVKNSLVQDYLRLLNTASKEELMKLKGIGEKRAAYILETREESPEHFKNLDDLKDIGLSAKQIKGMIKTQIGGLFN